MGTTIQLIPERLKSVCVGEPKTMASSNTVVVKMRRAGYSAMAVELAPPQTMRHGRCSELGLPGLGIPRLGIETGRQSIGLASWLCAVKLRP